MVVELQVKIPKNVFHVNLLSILIGDEDIGHVNHIIEQVDGDIFLCSVDVIKGKEDYVREKLK